MLAPVTHILPLTNIRRERLLPVPGRVVVRKGQKVTATDVIAEANCSPEHQVLDIGRGLGLSEQAADQQIQVKPSAQVAAGDVLAGPVGLAKRVVRAPESGRVIQAGSGRVLLELDRPSYELKAGFPGTVVELLGERGAVIENSGALIQGVWGNGLIDYGLMILLASTPEELLTADRLAVNLRGSIIVAGHCADVRALEAAAELPLRGMILSSLDPELLPDAASLGFPVIVIEGFGQRAMNSVAYKILSANHKQEAAINAEPWDRFLGKRPEVVVPLPAAANEAHSLTPKLKDIQVFSPGQQVRVIRSTHISRIGTLVKLLGTVVLPSGVHAQAALIHLETGENAVLPLRNLEVLE
jgi:hypothetical protein